jgi:15-cis-phytoene synthase
MKYKSEELKDSYFYAERIMHEKAVSFYQAFSKLSEKRFYSVCAVYAFCRYVDDLVDGFDKDNLKPNEKEKVLKELQDIETSILNLEKETKKQSLIYPWWSAFEDTFFSYHMAAEPFCWQIQGQRYDLDFVEIQTIEELIHYSKLVAGSVGYMLLPILVSETKNWDINLINACVDLGIGMQITNILRDVGEDLIKRNRVYLPQTLLKNYQLENEDLRRFFENFPLYYNTTCFKQFINLWEELANISKEYYESMEPYIMEFDKTCRLPLAAASKIYQSIEQAVRDERYDCFTKRCYTKKTVRNAILVQVMNTLNNKARG